MQNLPRETEIIFSEIKDFDFVWIKETPVPIPNTAVKLYCAYDTAFAGNSVAWQD